MHVECLCWNCRQSIFWKVWINDYLYKIAVATDLNIIALRNSYENQEIIINRYIGESSLDYLNKEEGYANNLVRLYCKKLKKIIL